MTEDAERPAAAVFSIARPVGDRCLVYDAEESAFRSLNTPRPPSYLDGSAQRADEKRKAARERSRLWREEQRKKRAGGGETQQQNVVGGKEAVSLVALGDLEEIARAVTAISVALAPLPAADRMKAMDMVALMLGS